MAAASRPEASSSQATLLGEGVHWQRMLPLGVEKWHATFDLLGRLHAKWPDAPRAPDALADPD